MKTSRKSKWTRREENGGGGGRVVQKWDPHEKYTCVHMVGLFWGPPRGRCSGEDTPFAGVSLWCALRRASILYNRSLSQ